jgi:hypothetical protein
MRFCKKIIFELPRLCDFENIYFLCFRMSAVLQTDFLFASALLRFYKYTFFALPHNGGSMKKIFLRFRAARLFGRPGNFIYICRQI